MATVARGPGPFSRRARGGGRENERFGPRRGGSEKGRSVSNSSKCGLSADQVAAGAADARAERQPALPRACLSVSKPCHPISCDGSSRSTLSDRYWSPSTSIRFSSTTDGRCWRTSRLAWAASATTALGAGTPTADPRRRRTCSRARLPSSCGAARRMQSSSPHPSRHGGHGPLPSLPAIRAADKALRRRARRPTAPRRPRRPHRGSVGKLRSLGWLDHSMVKRRNGGPCRFPPWRKWAKARRVSPERLALRRRSDGAMDSAVVALEGAASAGGSGHLRRSALGRPGGSGRVRLWESGSSWPRSGSS